MLNGLNTLVVRFPQCISVQVYFISPSDRRVFRYKCGQMVWVLPRKPHSTVVAGSTVMRRERASIGRERGIPGLRDRSVRTSEPLVRLVRGIHVHTRYHKLSDRRATRVTKHHQCRLRANWLLPQSGDYRTSLGWLSKFVLRCA